MIITPLEHVAPVARWVFETRLVRPEGVGTWTFAPVVPKIAEETGVRARLRVKGKIDGIPFSGTLLPQGSGRHFIVVNKDLRDRIRKVAGDRVRIELEIDASPAKIKVPRELAAALAKDPRAKAAFDEMAPSHRKAYVAWVEEAKNPATRAKRIAKVVEMILAGRHM